MPRGDLLSPSRRTVANKSSDGRAVVGCSALKPVQSEDSPVDVQMQVQSLSHAWCHRRALQLELVRIASSEARDTALYVEQTIAHLCSKPFWQMFNSRLSAQVKAIAAWSNCNARLWASLQNRNFCQQEEVLFTARQVFSQKSKVNGDRRVPEVASDCTLCAAADSSRLGGRSG